MAMSWIQSQQRRRFLKTSLWLIPAACMVAALLAAPLIRWLDDQTRWGLMDFGPEGARAVVGSIGASLLTFIVFGFNMLLLAVQMTSGQLSPRMIARVFEGRLTKLTVGAFVFAWVYTIAALGRVEDRVPQLSIALAIILSLVSVVLFLYLVQNAIKSLRPGAILTDLARDTRTAIETVYPEKFSKAGDEHAGVGLDSSRATRTIAHQGHSGVVLAFNVGDLVSMAKQADCAVEIIPQVGDFLARGEDLFRVHGAAASLDEERLRRCVAMGAERTLVQDPAFGFRIIVDIATKALSPAINDPTTAVLAIDQLHHLLHLLGERRLETGAVRDAAGKVRLIYRTPCWEDFISLATTEIRLYGTQNPQVTRRLHAMYEHLMRTLPAARTGALQVQMALLHRAVDRQFSDPHDHAIALRGDMQGLGSPQRSSDSAGS